jgi:hypothetical protein
MSRDVLLVRYNGQLVFKSDDETEEALLLI